MPENANTPKDLSQLTPAEARAELARREQAKMSRRDALARFGFKAAAAAVAVLTADDLLRAVGRDMQRRAGDNQVAQAVAQQFKDAGIAAAVGGRPPCSMCVTAVRPVGDGEQPATVYCGAGYCAQRMHCKDTYLCGGDFPDYPGFWSCLDRAKQGYADCTSNGATSGCPSDPVDCDCQQNENC